MFSGLMYIGDPIYKVTSPYYSIDLDKPKSIILIFSPSINILSGLMSLWDIPLRLSVWTLDK